MMAPTIRLFGPAIGMLSVSVALTGGALLIAAWAVFRQLGPAPGLWAAVVLSAITFTTGATSLVYPVSSNIAGYPLLCAAVLSWCLLCGDIRLLPLATAVVSFTAQQHLSVVPTLVVVTAAGTGGLAYHAWRRGWIHPPHRRSLVRWVAASSALGLALWSPVIIDQLTGRPGNITRIARFAADGSRPSVGLRSALRQVANVLGLPPLLGRTELNGYDLLTRPTTLTWATAALTCSAIALLGVHWRRTHPRRAALCLLAAALVAGGLYNGSSVPAGLEQGRLSLYHGRSPSRSPRCWHSVSAWPSSHRTPACPPGSTPECAPSWSSVRSPRSCHRPPSTPPSTDTPTSCRPPAATSHAPRSTRWWTTSSPTSRPTDPERCC